ARRCPGLPTIGGDFDGLPFSDGHATTVVLWSEADARSADRTAQARCRPGSATVRRLLDQKCWWLAWIRRRLRPEERLDAGGPRGSGPFRCVESSPDAWPEGWPAGARR